MLAGAQTLRRNRERLLHDWQRQKLSSISLPQAEDLRSFIDGQRLTGSDLNLRDDRLTRFGLDRPLFSCGICEEVRVLAAVSHIFDEELMFRRQLLWSIRWLASW